ncbi:hypothetical protein VTO42DRAFT_667 [Malbranchea cinnamomea]
MNEKYGLSRSFNETIAGFTAGIVSTLAVHPLDMVKTRLQVDKESASRIGSSLRVARQIAGNEGGIQAFYRGLTPNLVGNSVSWGLYFLFYGQIKDAMSKSYRPGRDGLGSVNYFIASGAAGILTAILTNPIWVIKTRMLSTGARVPGAYASFSAGISEIYRTEGVRGFYHGLVPSLFGVSHGALQFMAYEQLKQYRSRTPQTDLTGAATEPYERRELSNLDYFCLSGLAKVFAGCVTYPYQLLRSRLQTYDAAQTYRGVGDAIVQTWRKEGIAGFYKGLGPNLVRVLPSTWITFLVYENMRKALNPLSRD